MLSFPFNHRYCATSILFCCVAFFTLTTVGSAEVSRQGESQIGPLIQGEAESVSRPIAAAQAEIIELGDASFYETDHIGASFMPSGSAIACDAHVLAGAGCELNSCCGSTRFWASAEYMYWHMLGGRIPPLVTSSLPGTTRDDAGVLNAPTTTVLLGNDSFVDGGESGGRFGFGFWLDDCRDVGVEFIYTMVGTSSDALSVSSNEAAILARPFFNIQTGTEDARILGFPNEVSGGVQIAGSTSYDVYEFLIHRPISRDCWTPTHVVYGYRAAELDDSLSISDVSQSLSGATSGASVQSRDSFRSRNVFHGFEAGIQTDFRLSQCWQLGINGKVAFGETSHRTTILGTSTATNSQGNSTTTPNGLLAQQSNTGVFRSNSHSVIQDLTVRLQRRVRRGMTGSIAYTIHRWNSIARASEQIDRSINPTQIPPGTLVGEARPEHRGTTNDFVAQGITLGLEYSW